MTQATDNDLKELKDLIYQSIAESKQQFNELDKKMVIGFAESDKKMAVGFAELSGKIEAVDAKVEASEKRLSESISNLDKRLTESIFNLDKRVEKIEFVFRNVLISVVVAVLIGLLRILWIYPFDFKP